MAGLASISIKIDRSVVDEASAIARDMGMTLSAAIILFVYQMIKDKKKTVATLSLDEEADDMRQLIEGIRAENQKRGFLSDEEINAEIQAYRSEMRTINL